MYSTYMYMYMYSKKVPTCIVSNSKRPLQSQHCPNRMTRRSTPPPAPPPLLPHQHEARAQGGPSGTWHADALRSCPRSHLRDVALLYRRPFDHPFWVLFESRPCRVRLFGVWKASHTLIETLLIPIAGARNTSTCAFAPCGCWTERIDYTAGSLVHMRPSRTRNARLEHLTAVRQSETFFSVALTREPSERFLSGYHEHYSRTAEARQARRASNETSLHARLAALEEFVDKELSKVPATTALRPGDQNFERDWHVAPQVAFLTNGTGEPHRIDYVASHIGDAYRLHRELAFVGVVSNQSDELSYMRGKNSSIVVESRRIGLGELVEATNASSASMRVLRKICWAMRVDYCCLGYAFPSVCSDFTELC